MISTDLLHGLVTLIQLSIKLKMFAKTKSLLVTPGIDCLNIHRNPVTANNSTNNNVVFFLFQI